MSELFDNPQPAITHLDKNVPANWRPVPGLQNRSSRMDFSDRLFYWLVSLGGIALAIAGIGVCWLGFGKWGGWMIGMGIAIFAIGPSQAARKGYRI